MKDMVSNVRIEPQAIGVASSLVTHPNCSASMRQEMTCKALSSRQDVIGAEFPNMYSGFEQQFGKYTHGSDSLPNDVKVLAVIPKFTVQRGVVGIENNPTKTIIYRDLDTGEVGYYNLMSYTKLSSGYGYYNSVRPCNLVEGTVIRSDEPLSTSPSIKNGLYCNGVNANAVYLSREDTTEDAIPISESLADKLSPLRIETISINIDISKFPLNVHGTASEYGIVPNLGASIGPAGVVAAFRKVTESSLFDLTVDKLSTIQYLHDSLIYASPNSRVIDIDVIANRLHNSVDLPVGVYDQVYRYHEQAITYYRRIYIEYLKLTEANHTITPQFSTLVHTAMKRLSAAGVVMKGLSKTACRLVHKGGKDFNITIDIVLAKRVPVREGFKLSDGYGNKGVVVTIIPDEDMPEDENGFRTDIIIDTTSPLKRTNVGQFKVHAINRVAKWVARHLHELKTVEERFERICEFVNLVNPTNVGVLKEAYDTPRLRERYVNFCMEDTIYVFHPPSCYADSDENILEMFRRFKVPVSPVSFNITVNGEKKRITTKTPALIGSKYIYLLHKYPKPIASGFGYVNKLHMVTKNKFKLGSPISNTHCRFGEAEHRMFVVAGCEEEISRMRCLYGNSLVGPKVAMDSILNSKTPSKLGRVDVDTEELKDNESAIVAANNMLRTLGIEARDILIDSVEAEEHFKELSKLEIEIKDGGYS